MVRLLTRGWIHLGLVIMRDQKKKKKTISFSFSSIFYSDFFFLKNIGVFFRVDLLIGLINVLKQMLSGIGGLIVWIFFLIYINMLFFCSMWRCSLLLSNTLNLVHFHVILYNSFQFRLILNFTSSHHIFLCLRFIMVYGSYLPEQKME